MTKYQKGQSGRQIFKFGPYEWRWFSKCTCHPLGAVGYEFSFQHAVESLDKHIRECRGMSQ